MPFCRLPLLLLALLTALAPAHARAEMTAAPIPGGPRGDWALLTFQVPPLATPGELTLRDSRGGVEIVRRVPPQTRSVIVSMPLIAPAELLGGDWMIDAALSEGGTLREKDRLHLTIAAEQMAFTVAVSEGNPLPPRLSASLSSLPLTTVEVPAEDLLRGPPLLVAGCDAVLVPAETDQLQLEALAATGLRLIATRAFNASWEPLADGYWTWPAEPLRRATLVEPGLREVAPAPAVVNGHIRTALWLLVPAALVAALIARGLFKTPIAIAGGVAGALLLLTVGTSYYIHHADDVTTEMTRFREGTIRESASTMTAADVEYFTETSILSHPFQIPARPGTIVLPIFESPAAFFASDARLVLSSTPMAFTGTRNAREPLRYARVGTATVRIPSEPHWIASGYVYRTKPLITNGAGDILIKRWASTLGPLELSLRTWESTRYNSRQFYQAWVDEGIPVIGLLR